MLAVPVMVSSIVTNRQVGDRNPEVERSGIFGFVRGGDGHAVGHDAGEGRRRGEYSGGGDNLKGGHIGAAQCVANAGIRRAAGIYGFGVIHRVGGRGVDGDRDRVRAGGCAAIGEYRRGVIQHHRRGAGQRVRGVDRRQGQTGIEGGGGVLDGAAVQSKCVCAGVGEVAGVVSGAYRIGESQDGRATAGVGGSAVVVAGIQCQLRRAGDRD